MGFGVDIHNLPPKLFPLFLCPPPLSLSPTQKKSKRGKISVVCNHARVFAVCMPLKNDKDNPLTRLYAAHHLEINNAYVLINKITRTLL